MLAGVPGAGVPAKLLVAGLGNLPFPLTRHSLGHYIVEALADRLGIRLAYDKNIDGFMGTSTVQLSDLSGRNVTVTLLKPKPYMNLSGLPVRKALLRQSLGPENLVVIHDSVQHRPCYLSPKFGGSAEGHNGVANIVLKLANEKNFHRLRVGIGRGEGDLTDYVLGRLSSFEKDYWGVDGRGLDSVLDALDKISQKRA